jgi:predicted house-cleaning NTP pyrophosphatase (Maf/HAM1 superfamily)
MDILGVNYEVRPSAIDEKAIREADAGVLTRKLAEAKAWAVVRSLGSGEVGSATGAPAAQTAVGEGPAVVVAGDAGVEKGGRIFEKPVNYTHAMEFLHELSGGAFKFVTSLVVIRSDTRKVLSTVETSTIRFRELVDREIKDYLLHYPVLKFAGGFEGDGVLRFAESVSGSCNFMTGIPVSRLAVFLREMGVAV